MKGQLEVNKVLRRKRHSNRFGLVGIIIRTMRLVACGHRQRNDQSNHCANWARFASAILSIDSNSNVYENTIGLDYKVSVNARGHPNRQRVLVAATHRLVASYGWINNGRSILINKQILA